MTRSRTHTPADALEKLRKMKPLSAAEMSALMRGIMEGHP
jgi:hypothetical protein